MVPENDVEHKIEFDTEKTDDQKRRKILYSRLEPSSVEPRLIRFLIGKHLIKNERQADFVLVCFFVICIAASIILFKHSSSSSSVPVTTDSVLKVISR